MIEFEKFTLQNGLRVLVNQDKSTPIVAFNVLYDIGARDEEASRTGFAHLFEHLMFGGSKNIPSFDAPLQNAGGQSNAFTSNDITNYFCTLPLANLETAFWLESDRMNELAFTPNSLKVQKNVVIEEFKQRYLNQPYGDVWLLLRPLAYQKHPYKWATIGKEIAHIEEANMEYVKSFFYKHYGPEKAILSIAGDVTLEQIEELSEKWFGSITKRAPYLRNLPMESVQKSVRKLTVDRNVPNDAIYMTFHMNGRNDPQYHEADLLSDILSRGKSSRLYTQLVINNPKFIEINAYVTGSLDPGLFVISGKPVSGVSNGEAYELIWEQLNSLRNEQVSDRELQKVKNKIESTRIFSEMNVLNKAMNLGFFELMESASLVNQEIEKYQSVSIDRIKKCATALFKEENCSVLFYNSIK